MWAQCWKHGPWALMGTHGGKVPHTSLPTALFLHYHVEARTRRILPLSLNVPKGIKISGGLWEGRRGEPPAAWPGAVQQSWVPHNQREAALAVINCPFLDKVKTQQDRVILANPLDGMGERIQNGARTKHHAAKSWKTGVGCSCSKPFQVSVAAWGRQALPRATAPSLFKRNIFQKGRVGLLLPYRPHTDGMTSQGYAQPPSPESGRGL